MAEVRHNIKLAEAGTVKFLDERSPISVMYADRLIA